MAQSTTDPSVAEKAATEEEDRRSCPLLGLSSTLIQAQAIRRKDIQDLGVAFQTALSPVKEVLQHMQGLNERWALSNRLLRRVIFFQVGVTAVSLASLGLIFMALDSSRAALSEVRAQGSRLSTLEQKVSGAASAISSVRSGVDDVREAEASKPKLEFVTETDPAKAKRAPVKLVVRPPSSAVAAPRVSAVPLSSASSPAPLEIPVSAESP